MGLVRIALASVGVLALLLFAAPSRAAAASSLLVDMHLRFGADCGSGSGYVYFGASESRPDDVRGGFEAVNWDAGSSVELRSWQEFSGAERDVARRGLSVVLVAADGESVLFQRDLVFKTSPPETMYRFTPWLDLSCSTTPFRELDRSPEMLHLEVNFSEGCPATSGYWHLGDPSLGFDPKRNELWPATWGAGEPIRADVYLHYELVGGPPPSYPFTLVGTDGRTVLFQRHLNFQFNELEFPEFALTTWLDCGGIPYAEVDAPDTAIARDGGMPWRTTGIILAVLGLSLGVRRGLMRDGGLRHARGRSGR